MLPSLKSRNGVQKSGPPTPKMGSKKFANPSVFFFDDLKNIVHKFFLPNTFTDEIFNISQMDLIWVPTLG
jgi:hypothetical protein